MYLSSKLKGAVCAFVLASSSTGALAQVGPGVLGLYNPATGAFQPAPPARLMTEESEGTPRAAVNRTGRIIINIQIDIDTNIGGTTVPSCSASISHSPTGTFFSESASKTSDRTGNTATCQMVMSYRWPGANTGFPVTGSIFVSGNNRTIGRQLVPFDLPGNGATKTINLNDVRI
jgi:hypothetical protein